MEKKDREIVLNWLKESSENYPFAFDEQFRGEIFEGLAFLLYKTDDLKLMRTVADEFREIGANIDRLFDSGKIKQEGFTEEERDYVRKFLHDGFEGNESERGEHRLFSLAWPYSESFVRGLGTLIAGTKDAALNFEYFKDWAIVRGQTIKNLDEVKANMIAVLNSDDPNDKQIQEALVNYISHVAECV